MLKIGEEYVLTRLVEARQNRYDPSTGVLVGSVPSLLEVVVARGRVKGFEFGLIEFDDGGFISAHGLRGVLAAVFDAEAKREP